MVDCHDCQDCQDCQDCEWWIVKRVTQVVQRVVFLHEDLVKLPSFPRKALEAELDLFEGGSIGKELQGVDVLHKFTWIRLISRYLNC